MYVCIVSCYIVCLCSDHVHGESGSVRRPIVPGRWADAGADRSRRQTGVGVLGRHRRSLLHCADGTAVLRRFCSPGSHKQRLSLMNNQHHLTYDLDWGRVFKSWHGADSSAYALPVSLLSRCDKRKQSIYVHTSMFYQLLCELWYTSKFSERLVCNIFPHFRRHSIQSKHFVCLRFKILTLLWCIIWCYYV